MNERRRVLIADDEAEIRALLAEFLTLRGFEVLEATNGLETLLQVKRQAPDAVLLDLRMPRLGGIDALKRIHAFNSAINVIVITAEVDPKLAEQARALGARTVLGKPVDLAAVFAALGGDASVQAPHAPAKTAVGAAPMATAPAGPMTRVLVVDDDAEMREMLTELLARRNYQVSVAADGASAVRMIVDAAPDVVLLDIDMPGLKGTDALPTIRAVAPRAVVIMVSGTADADLAKRALALGAFDYIIKPVDVNYLTQSLETALAMKALEPAP